MGNKESNLKSNIATGASSSVGAAMGVAAASAFTQPAQAVEIEEPAPATQPQEPGHQPSKPGQSSGPEQVKPVPEPEKPEPEKPEPEKPEEHDVQVVSYETVTNEDGSQMDIAVVAVDGEPVIVGDLNQDGIADVIAHDENHNLQLEPEEVQDISGQQLAMQPLHDAVSAEMDGGLAQNSIEPDYTNDANVDAYMS